PALALMLWTNRGKTPLPVTFGLCWFATVLGFFTISAGKCLVYILPLFAALIGWTIATAIENPRANLSHRFFDWAAVAIATGVLVIIVAVAALAFSGSASALDAHLHRSDQRFLDLLIAVTAQGSPGVILWITLSILGAVMALSSVVRGQSYAQPAGITLVAIAGTLFWY